MLYLVWHNLVIVAISIAVGLLAGFLIFGGAYSIANEAEGEKTALSEEIATLQDELTERENDVTRLRAKLRLAAAELEKRGKQINAARQLHGQRRCNTEN